MNRYAVEIYLYGSTLFLAPTYQNMNCIVIYLSSFVECSVDIENLLLGQLIEEAMDKGKVLNENSCSSKGMPAKALGLKTWGNVLKKCKHSLVELSDESNCLYDIYKMIVEKKGLVGDGITEVSIDDYASIGKAVKAALDIE